MATKCPDGQLICRVQNGDLEALGELYEEYRLMVYRTALAITGDQDMAEDVLQEVFLRMYRYAATIDTNVSLEPWLYRVTTRVTYTWVKRVRQLVEHLQGAAGRWDLARSLQSGPEQVAEERERWVSVHKAIDTLPRVHRVVVVLHYLEGLSTRELADVMEIPEGTVKSRLHYAREKLRTLLQEEGYGPAAEVVYDFT